MVMKDKLQVLMNSVNLEGKSESFKQFIDSLTIKDRESANNIYVLDTKNVSKEECTVAENILLSLLKITDDPRVPRALIHIGSENAIKALKKMINKKKGRMLISIAESLYALTGEESILNNIINVLHKSQDEYARNDAVFALENFKGEKVELALLKAMNDKDSLVRGNAQTVLFNVSGLNKWRTAEKCGIELLEFQLMSKFKSIREKAMMELSFILKEKRKGKKSSDLNIPTSNVEESIHFVNFKNSYLSEIKQPWDKDYDLDSLNKVTLKEKIWAEYVCFSKMWKNDFRAVRTLVFLNSKTAIGPFKELLPKTKGLMFIELVYGIWAISGNTNEIKKVKKYLNDEDEKVRKRAEEVLDLINNSKS